MSQERYRELLELVHNRAGDAFRAAFRYDESEWTTLYARDDVATDKLREVLPVLVDRVRAQEPIVPQDIYDGVGETQATVELHAKAALLHITESDTDGVVISLDRDVAQGLGQFVDQCDAVLGGGVDTAGCTFVQIFDTPGAEFFRNVTAGSMTR